MKDITDRFIVVYNLLKDRGYISNPSEFAKKIRISTSMMNEILKGRSNAGIKVIQNIVKEYNFINTEYLILGIGDIEKKIGDISIFGTNYGVNNTGINHGNIAIHQPYSSDTKNEENLIKKNDNINDKKNDKKPNVQKNLSNDDADRETLQKEVQELKERLQDNKDYINTLKEQVQDLKKDKERALQEKDSWEHRYNMAQSEIRQLKNVQDMGDTTALVD